jgi:hypothetical protein
MNLGSYRSLAVCNYTLKQVFDILQLKGGSQSTGIVYL